MSSLELESLASAVDGVAEVAAIGIKDEKWGERPLLLIVAKNGADEGDISDRIVAAAQDAVKAGSLSKWAMPGEFHFVTDLAKTSVGKIDKKRLRGEYA